MRTNRVEYGEKVLTIYTFLFQCTKVFEEWPSKITLKEVICIFLFCRKSVVAKEFLGIYWQHQCLKKPSCKIGVLQEKTNRT